jgi:hypothetical protein
MQNRPTGVVILSVLSGISSLLTLAIGVSLVAGGDFQVWGMILAFMSIVSLGVAAGLYTLQNWARWMTIIVQGSLCIMNLLAAFQTSGGSLLEFLLAGAIAGYLLFDDDVEQAFTTASAS